MKSVRLARQITSVILFACVLAALFFNFSTFFPALKKNAFSIANKADSPINIPQNLNFLNDDKEAFITYCNAIYGASLPLSVDSSSFEYEGALNGYHFYRMQADLVGTEPAVQYVRLGGYTFVSDQLYRPSPTGLYLIKNSVVYTLEEAYSQNLVNFSELYALYQKKDPVGSAMAAASSK